MIVKVKNNLRSNLYAFGRALTQNTITMKGLEKRIIPTLLALLFAGALLTSASTTSSKHIKATIEEDFYYMEEVEDFVDDYFDSIQIEDEDSSVESIKIYNENGDLIIEENITDTLSKELLKLMRQSDFLTEYDNTTYYRLNS
jgi:hypothetical protein